ncbi:MAPEG family protein [Shewanella sp. NIFS-20-20]|uniref:MAPEG family protein n=1 Tax=Shewanella sp. NIFS-20-20 TaxID=2853806 RepID=UPI001C46DF03|nr:MAPEG family protein [Shewanella sp. NIFS-20-20]MBV7315532.1 MAPEG family protein [Shewanella sp. NIFS-20-20]
MFATYSLAFWGLLAIMFTVLIQAIVAATSKAAQPGAIPGKIDASLSHGSFVFRANRTFANSQENISLMLGASFLAILVGVDALWTGTIIWIMAVARVIHMVLYYAIATEKNPSPRSYFYLIALLANIALLVVASLALI